MGKESYLSQYELAVFKGGAGTYAINGRTIQLLQGIYESSSSCSEADTS